METTLQQLTEKLTAQIAVEVVTEGDEFYSRFRLRVRNNGHEMIRRSTGQLLDIQQFTLDGTEVPKPDGSAHVAYLPWSQGDGGGKSNTFQTVGNLDVCHLGHPYVGRFTVPRCDSRELWLREDSIWRLTIEVAAVNTYRVVHTYEIHVEPLGMHAAPDGDGGYTRVLLPRFSVRVVS